MPELNGQAGNSEATATFLCNYFNKTDRFLPTSHLMLSQISRESELSFVISSALA